MKLILTGISICTRFFCIQWSIKTRKLKKEIGPEFSILAHFLKKNHIPLVAIFEAKGLLLS